MEKSGLLTDVKEGAHRQQDGQPADGNSGPLLVVVTGYNQKVVHVFRKEIHQILVVINNKKNVHKEWYLRELA